MTNDRWSAAAAALLTVSTALPSIAQTVASPLPAGGTGFIELAQAPPQPTPEEIKRKRELEQRKGPPPQQQQQRSQPPPGQPPKGPPPQTERRGGPSEGGRPTVGARPVEQSPPRNPGNSADHRKDWQHKSDQGRQAPGQQQAVPGAPQQPRDPAQRMTPRTVAPQQAPGGTPPPSATAPGQRTFGQQPRAVPESTTAAPPQQPPVGASRPGISPGAAGVAAGAAGIAAGAAGAAAVSNSRQPPAAGAAATSPPPTFDAVRQSRQQAVEDGGRRTVIQEPGNRIIIRQDNRVFIQNNNEADRFSRIRNAQTQRRPDGFIVSSYQRPDGFRVYSEVDSNGRLMRRYRRGPDGREFNIVDNRNFWRNVAIGAGVGAIATVVALNLARPTVTIPRHQYIVDYDRASDDDLYETLRAPPIDRLDRPYSLEEVRYNIALRERMRRIDLDAITFDSGSYQVTPEQFPKLERLARSINRVLRQNPDEVFMIEGHTDAVGADVDNLSLSDRRAEAVAQILTDEFGVPVENLVTQGYGEQFLKVETSGPERANRRVAVRRITPLMTER